jgi:hypothetical protein
VRFDADNARFSRQGGLFEGKTAAECRAGAAN